MAKWRARAHGSPSLQSAKFSHRCLQQQFRLTATRIRLSSEHSNETCVPRTWISSLCQQLLLRIGSSERIGGYISSRLFHKAKYLGAAVHCNRKPLVYISPFLIHQVNHHLYQSEAHSSKGTDSVSRRSNPQPTKDHHAALLLSPSTSPTPTQKPRRNLDKATPFDQRHEEANLILLNTSGHTRLSQEYNSQSGARRRISRVRPSPNLK